MKMPRNSRHAAGHPFHRHELDETGKHVFLCRSALSSKHVHVSRSRLFTRFGSVSFFRLFCTNHPAIPPDVGLFFGVCLGTQK